MASRQTARSGWFTRQQVAAFLGIGLQHFERRYQPLLAADDLKRDRRGGVRIRGSAAIDVYVCATRFKGDRAKYEVWKRRGQERQQ